jgi:hypothetical protein
MSKPREKATWLQKNQTPRQHLGGRQTAARKHESGIKNDDSLSETNGIEQGNENPFPRDLNDSM